MLTLSSQTLLGDLPLLEYDEYTTDPLVPGQINITETSAGVAEVQKVVVSSDARFVREVQSLTLTADDVSVDVSGTFNVTVSGASNAVLVPFDANATELEARISTPAPVSLPFVAGLFRLLPVCFRCRSSCRFIFLSTTMFRRSHVRGNTSLVPLVATVTPKRSKNEGSGVRTEAKSMVFSYFLPFDFVVVVVIDAAISYCS